MKVNSLAAVSACSTSSCCSFRASPLQKPHTQGARPPCHPRPGLAAPWLLSASASSGCSARKESRAVRPFLPDLAPFACFYPRCSLSQTPLPFRGRMIRCVAGPQFVYPLILCWALGAFHLLAVGCGVTAVNIHEPCLSVHGSSVFLGGLVPRRRIAGSYGHPALNFLWNPILVASVLHNPPAGLRGLVVPHPHQHRLLSFVFFFRNHPRGCEAVSGCGFDLHFLNNQWCGTYFHVPVRRFCIFMVEMSIQILSPLEPSEDGESKGYLLRAG